MATLETQLIKAVQEENLDEVRALIERGAKINISTSGRSPLSIAAHLGNIQMLELLLNSGRFSPQKESINVPGQNTICRKTKNKNKDLKKETQKNFNAHLHKRIRVQDELSKGNNGYYVFIHEDENISGESPEEANDINKNTTPSIDDVVTPEGMDKLEWDMEVKEGEICSDEEDIWSNQYRWYAKILANTYCTVIETPNVCDVNLQDSVGRCAIHYAAEYGHTNAVKLLINAGSRVDIGDVDSLTPLHLAANRGHYDVIEALLTSGAMVNAKTTDKLSALHYAASRGYTDIVKLLLANGANIDALDGTDRTPLKLAASRNLYDVAKVLVEHHARVNVEDIKGYTPLCEAVWQKSVKMAKLLLQGGAKLTPTPYLLHYAILHQHFEMVELLLESGSLVNVRDNQGNTPLITAAISGQTRIVKRLLDYGAYVDCCGSTSEKTALSAAIAWKGKTSESVIRALVLGGANLNKDCWKESPLASALVHEKFQIAGLLIGLGADISKGIQTSNGIRDAMVLVRRLGTFGLVKMLVYAGYDIHGKMPDIIYPSEWPVDMDSPTGWLQYHKYNPLSLSELARIKIRSLRQRKIPMEKYVSGLKLPPVLVRYLLLEDVSVQDTDIPIPYKVSVLPHIEF